jgi:hypothetical protein
MMPETNFNTSDYMEQYKAYLGDLGNIGSRYSTMNGFYMSVISALLAVLALTESGKVFGGVQKTTLWLVCGFACVLCVVWRETIKFYQTLFAAKFHVLRNLEQHLPVDCFKQEYDFIKGKSHLLAIEKFAPLLLLVFFLILGVLRVCWGG